MYKPISLLLFLVKLCIALVTLPYCLGISWRLVLYLSSHQMPDKTVWEEDDSESLWWPLLVDVGLVWLFIAQHTFMALAFWKQLLAELGMGSLCRLIYVFATSVMLQVLMDNWRPLPASPFWMIDTSERHVTWMFFVVLHAICWVIIVLAALTMDPLELLGLKQVWYELNGSQDPMSYKSPAARKLYSHMRHPGVGCLLTVLWAHPVMSLGRWFLAASWTLYLLLGFGVQHQDYVYLTQQVSYQRSATRKTIEIVE